ncbi:hypothetical protein Tco_0429744 [Tanacetum coccineum]
MSSSTVTYTSVYTDSELGRVFWGADEEPSDGGPLRVIVYGYDLLPMQPVAPPSPDYVPGPKHPPSPDYVPGYVANSDPDEDPKEDPEEDHTYYPADGGDGDDEPSNDYDDDTDDEDVEPFEDEDDEEEEEEHLAPADSSVVPIVDPVPSAGDTEAFARIAEHAAAPTPPLPVASPPLPLPSPLTTSPTDAGAPLGYRAAGIRMRAASPPLLLPSTSYRTDIPEAEMPPRKRACLTTPAPRLEIGESSAAGAARQPGTTLEADLRRDRVMETGYGITDTWDEIVEAMLEVAPTTLEGVNQRVTELATTVRQENEEFQVRLEDAQDDRAYLRARVNTLFRDRPYHRHTAMILDREAMYARIAWTSSEDRSAAIEAHVRTLEAHVATLIAQTSSLQTQLTTALGLVYFTVKKTTPRKRTTRASPATTTTPTSTLVTDAQLRALIEQGVAAVLAEHDAAEMGLTTMIQELAEEDKLKEKMESQSETTQTVSALKLPVLKTREYDLWRMRMEQYLTFTDHALWEVIVNGDSVSPIASASAGAEGLIHPKTAEQKLARKNELKAKSTLMLAILDEHLLKFHACKDAKSLWEAIKNRFGGNKESKKMQKTILKQNYENFATSSQEGLEKTYDRFQKLISQLEIHGEVIYQEDVNLKLLRSLPSTWNNIALIMRNKSNLDTLNMDDLYNNLKVYKSKIKGQTSSSLNSQNVAFVSSDNSSITNEIVNTAHSVSAASSKDQASTASYADDVMFSFFANQSNALQFDNEDLE